MATPQTFNVTGIFLSGNSFVGKYTIAISPSAEIILQSIINEWERKTIMQLLGVELGKLLIAYHGSSDPPTVRYDDLIAVFDLQENNCFFSYPTTQQIPIHSSLGIEDFLAAVIYYYFILNDQVKVTQSGLAICDVETAKVLSPIGAARFAEGKYNAALETSDAIQWFCRWKTDETTGEKIYPEFAGMKFDPQYGSIL